MALQLVPPPRPTGCHFKLVHQQGRGSNRKAIYVCQSHKGYCLPFATRGWSKKAPPIDMVLHCPSCHRQHIDAPETDAAYTAKLHESSWWELGGDKPARWENPPHRSHLCAFCGFIWRPADVPTNGVQCLKTRGANDS